MIAWQTILVFAASASVILRAVAGLSQHKIKRLLAYGDLRNYDCSEGILLLVGKQCENSRWRWLPSYLVQAMS